MPLPSNHPPRRRAHRSWRVLALLLLLHALPPGGGPLLEGSPLLSQARADDGDGGDGGDGGGSSGGGSSSGGDAGGRDIDPGPREPELPVQADRFRADELIALNPSPAALQRVGQWGARVVETSVQPGLGMRVVRLRLPPGIDARSALAVANERDPGVFDLHHLYQLAQSDGGNGFTARRECGHESSGNKKPQPKPGFL